MDVVALVPGMHHVCTRYRIAQYAAGLKAAGLDLTLEPLADDPLGRLRQLVRRRRDGVVILVRKTLPEWQTALLRRSVDRLVFDVDDAVFLRNSFDGRRRPSSVRFARFRSMARAADLVFAGNRHLAEAASFAGARRVSVVPTCIDVARYPLARHDDAEFRLGWIGSSSTLPSLMAAKPMFDAVADAVPAATLRVVCDAAPDLQRPSVEFTPWNEAAEPRLLADCAVGVSWLPDDPWTQGKCGLKVLQYMAAGLPVLANPVGVHPRMIPDAAGVVSANPADWSDAARAWAADPQLRRRMGRA
ncbi:MAG: glycosyltransferase, partial [Planctomycetia bacterium]